MTTGDHTEEGQGQAAGDPSSWITGGSLVRGAWRLALPMVAGAVLQDLFTIVDTIFVGLLGPAALAAVTVSGILLGIVYMFALGIQAGCTALVAQAVGTGDRLRAERVAAQSLLMAIGFSLLVAAVGVPLAEGFLVLLGAEPEVVRPGTSYLQVSMSCSFSMFLSVAFAAAMRAAGDAITPLKIVGLCNLVNIGLDPILIFGWLGAPALGVAGSAWATVISRTLAVILMAALFFVRGYRHFHLKLRDLAPHPTTILRITRIGVFGSGQALARHVSALVLGRLVALFGTVALAAYGIGMRLFFVFLMPGIGFGNAAATLVGQNVGARKPDRAARAAWLTTCMYGAVAVVVTVVFCALAEPIVVIFNREPEVVSTGVTFLRWYSATFVFVALSVILGRAMQGAGDTFWPMMITGIAMLLLRIPLAYGFAMSWGSVTGIWAGLAVSNVIQGTLFAAAFLWGRWKIIGESHLQQAALSTPGPALSDEGVPPSGGNE